MKIVKKIITILILSITIFSTGGIFQNKSMANNYLVNEVNLYSKGEMVSFSYREMGVAIQFVVYQKDGIEYPAYCLEPNLIGVTEQQGMKAIANKTLDNDKIWRVIMNGYPFKTPAELNCHNEHEAFAATSIAIYDGIYNYDWSKFEAYNEQGKRILTTAQSILEIAQKSKEVKPEGKVEIQRQSEKWEKDNLEEKYISKYYEVITNVESTEYTVKLEDVKNKEIKIVDENNKEKYKFSKGERFKVLIPITEIESATSNIDFKICVTSNLKTKPILYGETPSNIFQDYALTAGEWEFGESILEENYIKEENNEESKEDSNGKQEEIKDNLGENEEEIQNNLQEKQEQINYTSKQKASNKKKNIKEIALPRTGF